MSLLDFARRAGQSLLDFEWNVAPETSPLEQMPGIDPRMAQQAYKDNYRLASEASLRAGVSGLNMAPATRRLAQTAYEDDLMRSAKVVEEVRRARDASGARERLAELVAGTRPGLNEQQRSMLGVLSPDAGLDALGKLVRPEGEQMPVVPAADGAYVRQADGTYKFERTRSDRAGGGQARLLQKSVVNEATGQNDLVFYDPYTGAEVARQPGAGTAPGRGGIEQAKAAGFALRMDSSSTQLDNFGDYRPSAQELVTIQKIVSGEGGPLMMAALNGMLSPQAQRYAAYVNDWIRAKLRAESGAVIGVDEFIGDFLTFMPMPNDDAETLKTKQLLRRQANRAMQIMAGGAYQRPGGAPAPVGPVPPPPQAGAPIPGEVPNPSSWDQVVTPVNGAR
jgi:hypothetical protein